MKSFVALACMAVCTAASRHDRQKLYWSNLFLWQDEIDNPREGENILIYDEWEVIYDIGTSPVFESITVNGVLTFMPGQDSLLQTKHIWINRGEVIAGTAEEPFDGNIEIRLHGNSESQKQLDQEPEYHAVGNQNMIVNGYLGLFGTKRTRVTRLLDSAHPEAKTLIVDTGLDLVQGDKLGLPATNVQMYDSETVTVADYDPQTGIVTLTEPLQGYHFGQAQSTAENYDGVDMRGEVLLLSSNIRITSSNDAASNSIGSMSGDSPRPQGCILVSDSEYKYEGEMDFQYGWIEIDNVALDNCSHEADQAAIKFHNALYGGGTRVSNSAISSGLGKGIQITNSGVMTIDGNVIHDVVTWGIHADSGEQIVINNNFINGVKAEDSWLSSNQTQFDGKNSYVGGLYFGDIIDGTVTNNIVASTWHAGFILPSYQCGGTQVHSGNVAHSISGYGVIVQKPPYKTELDFQGIEKRIYVTDCIEFSDFKGYKTQSALLHMGDDLVAHTSKVRDIVAIDASTGVMAFKSEGGHVEVSNSRFYGDENMPNLDCPVGDSSCQCITKQGLTIPVFGGSWGGSSLMKDNKFIGYANKTTDCGGAQSAIVTNNAQSDYHPLAKFVGTEFKNVDESAMFGFGSPNEEWASPKECGEFTCTGLYNVLVEMKDTVYTDIDNSSELDLPSDFQVTSDNKGSDSVQVVDGCQHMSDWNAWRCENTDLGILLFESLDDDRMDRSAQPIFIQDDEQEFNNRLNAYRATCEDGTCEQREQRFPTFLDLSRSYTIEYSDTPPQQQKFSLYSDSTTHPGTLITIGYPSTSTYSIVNEERELVEPTGWDIETGTWAVPTGSRCGENRYDDVENILQFWIEPNCTLTVSVYPRDAIMLGIRLDLPINEFYELSHGEFTDMISDLLEIDPADIKAVQVFEEEPGVFIEFHIYAPYDDEDPMVTLQSIGQEFKGTAYMLEESFDAPVMQILTHEGDIITMEGYEDL